MPHILEANKSTDVEPILKNRKTSISLELPAGYN